MNSLIGIWLYTSLIYQGQPIARPDPSLKMYYSFNSSTENEIYYSHTSEIGFCHRKANYSLENGNIVQKIVSVDEHNADFCGGDPDMQLGGESKTEYEVDGNILYLHLQMGEETITYVWTKQTSIGE